MGGPIDERANRVLPFKPLVDLITLQIVAARKPQKLRMHCGHHLHQVRTIAVLAIVVRRRKDGNELQPHRSRMTERKAQMVL